MIIFPLHTHGRVIAENGYWPCAKASPGTLLHREQQIAYHVVVYRNKTRTKLISNFIDSEACQHVLTEVVTYLT